MFFLEDSPNNVLRYILHHISLTRLALNIRYRYDEELGTQHLAFDINYKLVGTSQCGEHCDDPTNWVTTFGDIFCDLILSLFV